MTITLSRVRNAIFAAAVTASMGFGATQALAAPKVEDSKPGTCSRICAPECGTFGGSYIAGRCYCCG
jgi:hypothetical protein